MNALTLYDEEFNRYLQLAKTLIAQLKSRDDREICIKWIRKLVSLTTNDVSVKRNRNAFFKYLLQTLQEGILEGLTEQPDMYVKRILEKKKEGPSFMSRWSSDKRTYVAAKPIPGKGALVYMAVAKDPSLGWDFPNKPKKPNV